jgi:hypothetical protein
VNAATFERSPLEPRITSGKVPAAAGAEKVNCRLEPAATEKGNAGEEVIPCGSPSTVIATEELNPFTASMETVMGDVCAPTSTEAADVESEIVKLAPGGRTGSEG